MIIIEYLSIIKNYVFILEYKYKYKITYFKNFN